MTTEQIEQTVLAKFRTLPPDKQQEVLDFVEFLERKSMASRAACWERSHIWAFMFRKKTLPQQGARGGVIPQERNRVEPVCWSLMTKKLKP